jgi:mannose-6-phosphate isomerase-like protein (cupin superfamily)
LHGYGCRIAAEMALAWNLKVENTRSMKSLLKAILALAVASLIGSAYAGGQPQAVIHFPHEMVDATFSTGGLLLQTNNYKIMAGRRSGLGAVEIHEKDTDIFYILDGTATFITGGTANGVTVKSPGELVAKEIVGGVTRHLAKGDVIVIPNGVPHWFTETSTPFLYFVVKVSQ